MIITNFKSLAKNSLRKKALLIMEAGYEAIDIKKVVSNKIKVVNDKKKEFLIIDAHSEKQKINLNNFERIFVVGIGKGSALASAALAEILGDKLTGGIALDIQKPKNFQFPISNFQFFVGTHPLPSEQNIKATQEIIKLAGKLNGKDLIITFICGGGSALACASEEELKNSILVTKTLTQKGAAIEELNTVRKHLSKFKGGGLAKMAYPSNVVSLIVSDVCGNDLSNVASGPTVYDKTTKKDAERILKKYQLPIADYHYQLYETPKDERCFKKVNNILFICNQDAVMAMVEKAEKLGFAVKIHSLAFEGEAKNIFGLMIENIKSGEAFIAAGETTVTLKNQKSEILNSKQISNSKFRNLKVGKGGRNMEAVLGALVQCQMSSNVMCQNVIFLSFASDARDNTEAAGAIGDSLALKKAEELQLSPQEFLSEHNSFSFFNKTGDLIYAEQKCFNVADLMLILKQ